MRSSSPWSLILRFVGVSIVCALGRLLGIRKRIALEDRGEESITSIYQDMLEKMLNRVRVT
jgi:hypothetical protein